MLMFDRASRGVDATSHPLRQLARLAAGRSGADIERLVREARRAARREGRNLTWQDIADRLGSEGRGRSQEVRWRIAVHEAGHALVRLAVGSGRITLISIDAAHGGVVQTAAEPNVPETEARLMAEITERLAGRAAEELVFAEPIAGSGGSPQSDLAIATAIATNMETTIGFGRHQPLLYRPMADYGHMLTLDAALAARVHARLEECHDRAKAILDSERETHLWLSNQIIDHGVLEGPKLESVLGESRQRLGQEAVAGSSMITETTSPRRYRQPK